MKNLGFNRQNWRKFGISAIIGGLVLGISTTYYLSQEAMKLPKNVADDFQQQQTTDNRHQDLAVKDSKEQTKQSAFVLPKVTKTHAKSQNVDETLQQIARDKATHSTLYYTDGKLAEVSTTNGDPFLAERKVYEEYVNKHQYSNRPAYNKKDWKALGLPRKDRPDWAFEQDFLRTMNPATREVPLEAKDIANQYAKKNIKDKKKGSQLLAAIPITWTERGPNNIGGRTRAIMFDPNDATNKKVWAAGTGGGLWFTNDITTDAGWTKVDDLWDNIAISCIAYAPNATQTFYVGTGEAYGGGVRGAGIWRTTNGGTTWTRMAGTEPTGTNFNFIQKIVVRANGEVLATTRGLFINQGGVMKFDGTNWTKVLAPRSGVGVAVDNTTFDWGCDIEIAANGDIYASTGFSQTQGKVYKSTDGGNTWTELPNAVAGATNPSRIELAVAPSNPNIIYAVAQNDNPSNNNQDVGMFRKSTDGGATWTNLPIPVTRNQPGSGCGLTTDHFTRAQAFWDLTIKVHPTNANLVLLAGIDAHRSLDGGATWNDISLWINRTPASNCGKGYIHADIHDAVFRPGNSNEVVWASDGGLDYSPNSGDAGVTTPTMASRIKDYNVTQFYSGDIAATAGSHLIIGGTQDNGTLLTNSTGIQPASSPSGGDGGYSFISKTNSDIRISSYTNCNYYRTNTGQTTGFPEITSASPLKGNGSFINPTEYDSDADVLYANIRGGGNTSTTDFFRISALSTATPVIAAVTITGATPGANAITHLKKSPHTANTLFLGLASGNLLKVTNANATPVGVAITGPAVGSVSCIEVGATENQLLVTYTNYGVASQVWETADGGATWRNKKGNLPDMPIRWALYNPANRNQIILATEVGCWSTDNFDNGGTGAPVWGSSNASLANTRCDMMKYRASDGLVLIATHGRGMYTTDVFVTTPIASFDMSPRISCTGNLTVNFTDGSVGANNIWAWDVDNNGTTDYTTRNPTHTYNAPGVYTVKLTINNGAATVTKTNEIIVMNAAPTAQTGCTNPTNVNNGNNNDLGIKRFALGSINSITPHNNGTYNDYSCIQATVLALNTTYTITITTSTLNNEGAKVYIDYNDNGNFGDAGEEVASFPANTTGTRTANFTTPTTGVTLGKGLRARIVSQLGAVPANACDAGAGAGEFGQIEDYSVFFQGATPTITLSAAALTAFTSCAGAVSAEQTYTVSGANLTNDVVITAPTGFNVSLTTGTGFGASVTVTTAAANAGATTIFVRQTAAAANGANGNITHTSTGSNNPTRAIPTSVVNALPNIGTQPSASTICAGANTTFTVAATGAGLMYQWQERVGLAPFTNITNGGVYSGATTATLTLTAATAGMNNNQYQCIVSGTCTPAATSNAVALTVNPTPTITGVSAANVTTAATTFNLAYTSVTNAPNQYSITTGTTAMAGFVAVTNATLGASPLAITIPASAANTYDFNLTVRNSVTGCVSAVVPFTLTVTAAATPTITLSAAALTAFTSCAGAVSAEQNYTVSGANLTNDVVITAPTGFNVSLTTGTGFGTSVTVTTAAANAGATTIFVRQTAAAANGASGNITHTSTGATAQNKAIPTSVVNATSTPTVGITPTAAVAGTQLFTAAAANIAGGTVAYDFQKNSVSQQNGAATTWNGTGLVAGDVIRCVITVTGGTCLTATTATSNTVTVTAAPTPTITLSAAALTAFTSCAGAVSAEQTYTVSGANLTNDVVITAPTGFNVSLTTGTGFGTSVTVTTAAANAGATTIFVRQTAAAANGASGNITHTSTGATAQNKAIPTSVVNATSTPTVNITPTAAVAGNQTFTATAANIAGGTVVYDFQKNSVSQQNGVATTWNGTGLVAGDVIRCVITVTGGTCLTATTATSNTVTVTAAPLPFITEWITTNGTFTISTDAALTYNYTVSYRELPAGMPTVLTGRTGDTPLTGLTNGVTYEVSITGTYPRFLINTSADRVKIRTIKQWGSLAWSSMRNAFVECTNLTYTATDAPDLSNVTDISGMFQGATAFNGNIGNWNTANVTNMSNMFSGATVFNQNIGTWNTANVTNMSNMFGIATAFNQNISTWNTANVTNMSFMFMNAVAFNQNIGTWNTANVTNMNQMFRAAAAFNQNIGTWNTANVTNMSQMFQSAISFNQNIGTWNTANVTDMSNMFSSATVFNQNIGTWNVANVANMVGMLQSATAFNQNIGTWNVANVTAMNFMLNNCGMNAANYDATLIGWAAQNVKTGVTLGSTGRNYTSAACAARSTLRNSKTWTITGDTGECINISTTALTAFTSCIGSVSAEQNYIVTGTNLTANISIVPPTGFEISTTTGGAFAATNPIVLTQTGGNVATTTIYVRQTAAAANGASGNITHTSTGQTAKNVAIPTSVVNALPNIGTQPTAQTVCANANATFTVAATGAGLTYQWQEKVGAGAFANITNGGVYSGATTATLTLTNPTAAMSTNQYQCIVSGTCTPAATSNAVALTVTPVNATPTLDNLAALNLATSAPAQIVNLAGIGMGAGDTGQTLTITATSSNVALIPNPTVTYTSPNATGSIGFTPVAAQTGTATITVTVTDNGGVVCGAINNVVRTFTVNVGTSTPPPPPPAAVAQTITFDSIPNKTFGDADFTLVARASSNLPVNFEVLTGGTGSVLVSGNTVIIRRAGTVTIQATQSGNASFRAATPVSRTFTINKANQTINFGNLSNVVWNSGSVSLSATSSANLPVSFAVTAGNTIASLVNGNILQFTQNVGSVSITATQAGNENYNAATAVVRTFQVLPVPSVQHQIQVINAPRNVIFGTSPVTLNAIANSGLPVTITLVSGNATLNGNVLTITGAGNIVLRFSQAGNATWEAATTVERTITVDRANQMITITPPVNMVVNTSQTLVATSSSGLPVVVSIVSGTGTVNGLTITPTAGNFLELEFTQVGNANFNAAAPVRASLVVIPTLSFANSSVAKACAGGNFTITYNVAGLFNSNNRMAVYLSDANGNFTNSRQLIGLVERTGGGTIPVVLPTNATSSNKYRIRVEGTAPEIFSNSSGDFEISALPEVPTIRQENDALVTSATSGIQWFFDGVAIAGATSQRYTPTDAQIMGRNNYAVIVTNANDCKSTSATFSGYVKSIPTSTADPVLSSKLSVYPNPAQDKVLLELGMEKAGKVSLRMVDALGKEVYQQTVTTTTTNLKHEINLTDIASGVYVLMVNVDGKVAVRRVVKQ
jgi:surface protein